LIADFAYESTLNCSFQWTSFVQVRIAEVDFEKRNDAMQVAGTKTRGISPSRIVPRGTNGDFIMACNAAG